MYYSLDKKENSIEIPKPVLRKKISRPPVPAESRLSKISTKSSTPPKCENPQRKSVEVNITILKFKLIYILFDELLYFYRY